MTAPCKIAQVTEATLAGVGRHTLDVVTGLAQTGDYEVHLLHSLRRVDTSYRNRLAQIPAGVRVHDVPMQRAIAPLGDTQAVLALYRYFRQHGPFGLVHLHSSKAAAVGGVAARLAGVPAIVFTPHAFISAGKVDGWRKALYVRLEQVCGWLAHRVIAVSQGECAYAVAQQIAPRQKLTVIPNSVPLPDLTEHAAHRARVRAEWQVPPEARLVGSVGRLSAQKDPLLFVELAARRMQRNPSTNERFVLVGEGELLPAVQQAIAHHGLGDRLIVAGFRADMPAVYASLDVYVLHSHYEGMPYTVLEAMSHGLPVMSARVEGVVELVHAPELIVPPGDVAAFDQALEHLAAPDARTRAGQQNRDVIQQHHSLEGMIASVRALYAELGLPSARHI